MDSAYLFIQTLDPSLVLAIRFSITISVGLLGALLFHRLKIPAAFIFGPLLVVVFFNIFSSIPYFPFAGRTIIQSFIGSYIGVSIRKEHIQSIHKLLLPIVFMMVSMLFTMIITSVLIYFFTDLDLATAIFSATPGGVFDMTILSMEFGADITIVALMQMIRLIGIIIIFPLWIKNISSKINTIPQPNDVVLTNSAKKYVYQPILTLSIGLVASALGVYSKLPAGALSFAMLFVAAFNITTGKAYIPIKLRRTTQIVAGSFLAMQLVLDSWITLGRLFVPVVIMLGLYLASNLLLSLFLDRYHYLDFYTALFATSPAGAAEMVMIADEFNINANKAHIAFMHVIRLILVISFFPLIIRWILHIVGNGIPL